MRTGIQCGSGRRCDSLRDSQEGGCTPGTCQAALRKRRAMAPCFHIQTPLMMRPGVTMKSVTAVKTGSEPHGE